ncbi:MAG: hypothetical protein KDK99_01125 [Verrucomicrobiales bacterium]|nr:hypothetical protein [Verrucomicrobiales bacterium]
MMTVSWSKLLALLLVIAFAITGFMQAGGVTIGAVKSSLGLLVPLALIWFPEELGQVTLPLARGGNVDTATPPVLISLAGWFLLVGLPVAIYFWG